MTLYALDGVAPSVDPAAWVAPGAHVMGAVSLAARSSIWFNAVLRGDTEPITVGAGTNIQEHSLCHTDAGFPLVIGENCTIGHTVILHGCTIGDGVLVGMGATIMNGAVIGANTLIGAGALITEGKEIPAGSLVMGAPAKVVRPLSAEQIAGLAASAQHYQENAERFRTGLVPVSPG